MNEAPLVRVLPRSQEASHQQAHHKRNSKGIDMDMAITCSHVVIKAKVWSQLSDESSLSCRAYAWARLGTWVVIVLPRLAWARLGSWVVIHKFCLSVCLLPWHSSLSAHYFHSAFSRATKLARPLAKVALSYCSIVFWKKRTEQKATNILKHEKLTQRSVRYFQQRLNISSKSHTYFLF